jgi:hypothetical protein
MPMNGTSRFTVIVARETQRRNTGSIFRGSRQSRPTSYNMSPSDKRTVRRIIFEHFDYIVTEWNKFQEGKNG